MASAVTARIARTPGAVLDFWLGPLREVSETSEAAWRERMLRWRVGVFARGFEDPDFSAAQREFCEALHEQGQAKLFSPAADWETPHGTLAKLIVLDQFPRCVYRGTPLAYEHDAQLAGMLREICSKGWDTTHYSVLERLWVYVPLSHPENRELQELSVAKWTQWASDLIAASPTKQRRVNQRVGWNFVKAVIEHAEAVVMHGKFPHRNPILCRPHRAGELHYLTSELRPPWSYTQPPRPDYYALHAALHGIERWADCRKVDRELLHKLHGVLGLDPAAADSCMDVFSVLGRDVIELRDVYRHFVLSRNAAFYTRAVTSAGLSKHVQNVTRAIFKDAPQAWRSSQARGGLPRVIDVPALNLAVGCPLLDRGEVCAPRSAIENFITTTHFRIASFEELYARYREVVAESVDGLEAEPEAVRRRAPIERAAFARIASTMFDPSPARDGVVNTLYELLDLDYDGTVDAGEVLVALVALCTGSVDDKLRVCFEVFDSDGNGRLDSTELRDLVHTTLLRGLHVVEALFRSYLPEGNRESTELVTLFSLANFSKIEHLAEKALEDSDHDRDGMIDEAEFRAWAGKHPLLVQLLTLSRVLFGS